MTYDDWNEGWDGVLIFFVVEKGIGDGGLGLD